MPRPAYVDTQNFGLDDLFYADELTMSRPFPLHRHSFAELHYIRGGAGREIINGTAYPLAPGCMSLKLPWHTHELQPGPGTPLQMYKASFRLSALEAGGPLQSVGTALARGYDACPLARLPDAARPEAEALFARLLAEHRGVQPFREEQLAALTAQLLVLFIRHRPRQAEEGCTANDILRLMNLRYREPALTCAAVAREVHYSESQVERLLQGQFGLTFGELLREIRIRNACELLKTTAHPVEAIARHVGYASRDGFYTAFAADRGLTPAAYRARCAAGQGGGVRVLSSAQLYAKTVYYLHRHYAEPVTAGQAAGYFHCGEAYLERVLREQGTTFARLLEEIRVYHARQLLREGGRTAEGVAQAVGFASPETFYRAFRRQTGCTPGAFCRGPAGDAAKEDAAGGDTAKEDTAGTAAADGDAAKPDSV